jgi:tetratricopeptide (TPR) repeat protein
MRARLLHGYGFMLCLRGEYAEALAVADRAEALGSRNNDPTLLSTACTVHGQVDQLQGRSQAAREWLERGLGAAKGLDVGPGEFLVDPQVGLLALLSVPLLHLGLVAQGRSCLERANERARARGWPMARLVAIWYSALFEVRLGNTERVAALADEMHGLVEEFALAHGRAAWRWFRGWSDARRGHPREGFRAIRQAHEDNMRLGMVIGGSEILGYAAEALLLAEDFDGAQVQLSEALAIARDVDERVYLPQLYLMQATIARARGDRAAGDASLRQALAEARSQQAPWLELMALMRCATAVLRAPPIKRRGRRSSIECPRPRIPTPLREHASCLASSRRSCCKSSLYPDVSLTTREAAGFNVSGIMSLPALDHALHAVRTYLVECTERKGWDDQRTSELGEVIRSCVESIGANHRDSRASVRLPVEALGHAIAYVDEHLRAVDLA